MYFRGHPSYVFLKFPQPTCLVFDTTLSSSWLSLIVMNQLCRFTKITIKQHSLQTLKNINILPWLKIDYVIMMYKIYKL